MDRIRLLYCIDSVGSDAGPDRQLAELVARLDKSRFDVHLCCMEESERLRELSQHCTPLVLPFRSLYSFAGWRAMRRLRRHIDERGIDIVHTFMVKANILGILAARRTRCRAVVSSRRNLGYWLTPFYLHLYRRLDRHTTRILANAERVRRFVIESERVPADKVDVLYNGVDTKRFAPNCGDASVARALGIRDGARVVGMVANLRPVKDPALFIRAAAEAARAVPDAAFLLVGAGPMRGELGRLADGLGLGGRVFFSDGRGRVEDYLGRMSIGCLSSQSEGFSNAVLEYMAAGLPVVATDAGGNAEAIENGLTGFIVKGRDPADFARPIVELLTDEGRRAEMGRKARERCCARFDIAVAVRNHEDYYASLVSRAAP